MSKQKGQKLKILIAEDDFISSMFFESIFHSCGHEVVAIVSQGEEALSKIQEYPLDLVLMDIGLSGSLNGIETAIKIRQSSPVPIVFLTGNSDILKNDKRLEQINPVATLIKPVDDMQLRQQIAVLFPDVV